jgi:glucosamine-phosphate N-acetyltransferase
MFQKIRQLQETDYHKGYLQLLSQLTTLGNIEYSNFVATLSHINHNPNHQIWVITDQDDTKILASGTLIIEPKFIHNCGSVGHIEDIVVSSQARGLGLGQQIVQHLIKQAKLHPTCYKVSLYCKEELTKFYEKSNLETKETQMVLYLK